MKPSPDNAPTPEQRIAYRSLIARIDAARAGHTSPWRTSRIRKLRTMLVRTWKTQDRWLIGQFLHEWRAGIESECRFLEDSSRAVELPDNVLAMPSARAVTLRAEPVPVSSASPFPSLSQGAR